MQKIRGSRIVPKADLTHGPTFDVIEYHMTKLIGQWVTAAGRQGRRVTELPSITWVTEEDQNFVELRMEGSVE